MTRTAIKARTQTENKRTNLRVTEPDPVSEERQGLTRSSGHASPPVSAEFELRDELALAADCWETHGPGRTAPA